MGRHRLDAPPEHGTAASIGSRARARRRPRHRRAVRWSRGAARGPRRGRQRDRRHPGGAGREADAGTHLLHVPPDTIAAGVAGPQPLALHVAIDRPAPPDGFTVEVTYDGPGLPSVSVGPVVLPPGDTAATQSFDVGGMLPVVDIVVQGHVGNDVVFAVVHVVATP